MKKKNKKISKKNLIIILAILVVAFSIAAPTLARFSNGLDNNLDLVFWDGSIATEYTKGTGTKEDPYIISNGSEFAYFSQSLENTTYKDTYFRLANDIILNKGFFIHEDGLNKYVLNEITYYIKDYTNELYTDVEYTTLSEEILYTFNDMDKFEGHLDGSFFSIYGLYLTDENKEELALFNTVSGSITDVFIENTLIVGGKNTAGIAVNATDFNLTNTFISGYVVNTRSSEDITSTNTLEDINLTTGVDVITSSIVLNHNLSKELVSSKITGNYVVDNEENINYELTINGQLISLGNFSVDLGSEPINEVLVNAGADVIERNISLTNLKYEEVYKLSYSSGLFNNASNVNINNTVNDINVYNEMNSSGFISNVNGPVNIINSYNTGDIKSKEVTSGIIGVINSSDVTINKVYNSGNLMGVNNYGIVGLISSGENIVISNTFNTTNNVLVNNEDKAILNNNYNSIISEDLTSVKLLDTNLLYTTEFSNVLTYGNYAVDSKLADNVWILKEGKLPELYFINEINLINIVAPSHEWNDNSFVVGNAYYKEDVKIAITSSAYVYTIDTVEYFIKYDNVPLLQEELELLEWIPYEGSFNLTGEGNYIVYTKLTNYAGEVRYINTDIITIDSTAPEATLLFKDNIWNSHRIDVTDIFVLDNADFTINAVDDSSGINNIEYHVSDEPLTEDQLNKLNEANWNEYESSFSIPAVGNNILYAKVADNSGNVMFLNSDMITYDGYHMNFIKAGQNDFFTAGEVINITRNSSVTANYLFNVPTYNEPEVNHRLNFSEPLPGGTVITLKDNVNNKIYDYKVPMSNTNTNILFADFNLAGNISNYFPESDYNNGAYIVEDFTITLNFENAIIVTDIIGLRMWMDVVNNSNVIVRETAALSIKEFNIYVNQNASMFFNSSTSSINIEDNIDSITTVNLNTGITYKNLSGSTIYDTYIEEQDIVMEFRILDSTNTIVPGSELSNFIFKIDDVSYYPDEEGVVTINLKSGVLEINKNLEIYAYKGDMFLEPGSYNLEMTSYVTYNNSYDSKYYVTTHRPLIIDPSIKSNSIYFRSDLTSDLILSKEEVSQFLDFETIFTGATDPSIRVSLYKKNEFNALDQGYTLINLNSYLNNPLTSTIETNKYLVASNYFTLDINASLLDRQAYKIVVDAYDGNTLIASSDKYFIIK